MLQIFKHGLSIIVLILLITPLSSVAFDKGDFDDETLKRAMTDKELVDWSSAEQKFKIKMATVERDHKQSMKVYERKYGKTASKLDKQINELRRSVDSELSKYESEYKRIERSYLTQNKKIEALRQSEGGTIPSIIRQRLRLKSNVRWPNNADKFQVIRDHAQEVGNQEWGVAWGKTKKLLDAAQDFQKRAEAAYRNAKNAETKIQRTNSLAALAEGNNYALKKIQYELQAFRIKSKLQLEVAISLIEKKSGSVNESSADELAILLDRKDKATAEAEKELAAIKDKIRERVSSRLLEKMGWVISGDEVLEVTSRQKLTENVTLGSYENKSSGSMRMSEKKTNTWYGNIKVDYHSEIKNTSPDADSPLVIEGDIEILNGSTLTIDADSSDIIITGHISNVGGGGKVIMKSGHDSKVVLTAANSYGGDISVERGILQIEHENALGSSGSGSGVSNTVVASGAALKIKILGAPVIRSEFFVFSGDGDQGNGVVQVIEGNVTFKSKSQLDSNSTFYVAEGSSLNFQREIMGVGDLVKTGRGKLELSSACEYQGLTAILDGTLSLGSRNVIPDTSEVIIGGGMLDMNGYSDTFTTLSITKNSIVDMGNKACVLTLSTLADASLSEHVLTVHNYTGEVGQINGKDLFVIMEHEQFSKLNQVKFFKDQGITQISNLNGFYEEGNHLVPLHEGSALTDAGFWYKVLDAIDMIALFLSGLIPLSWYIINKLKKGKGDEEEYEGSWATENNTVNSQSEVSAATWNDSGADYSAQQTGGWEVQWVQAEDGQWVYQDEHGNWLTEDGSVWQSQAGTDEQV